MSFNYQKAYCVLAVPAFNNLPAHVKKAHSDLLPIVGDLSQGRDLAIPLNDEIKAILKPLTTKELAELSRASHAVGHWHPSLLPYLFDTSKGESWKITNCADQVLRARIKTPHNILIHDGRFRVTFSSGDCWMREEFALATEENLEVFTSCGMGFGESSICASAAALATEIGDMWPDVETMAGNALYSEYLTLKQAREKKAILDDLRDKIARLEEDKINAQKKIDFLLECNRLQVSTNNIIYYSHTDTFCFGWRGSLSGKERQTIQEKLTDLPEQYKIEFK